MNIEPGDVLMGLADAAALLGVSRVRVRQYIRAGQLQATMVGGAYVTTRRQVMELLRRKGPPPRRPGPPKRES